MIQLKRPERGEGSLGAVDVSGSLRARIPSLSRKRSWGGFGTAGLLRALLFAAFLPGLLPLTLEARLTEVPDPAPTFALRSGNDSASQPRQHEEPAERESDQDTNQDMNQDANRDANRDAERPFEPRPLSVPPLSAVDPEESRDSDAGPAGPAGKAPSDSTGTVAPESSTPDGSPTPDWVHQRSDRHGDLRTRTVHSDYHASERDAWRALDEELQLVVSEYIAEHLGDPRAPLLVNYSLKEIKSRFLQPDHVHHEIREFGFGIMHQTHALLEFPPEFQRELDRLWQRVQQGGRVILTGSVTLGIILVLAAAFGLLRVEQRTRGSRTARLQFVVLTAILAVVLATLLGTSRPDDWLHWFLSL
jgi:hypothetical protein